MKTFLPLYSKQTWGKFYGPYPFGAFWPYTAGVYGYAIYQRRHTWHGLICIKEHYYNPHPRSVPWLLPYQIKFGSGVKQWQALGEENKDIWRSYTYHPQLAGFNRFMSYYLKQI